MLKFDLTTETGCNQAANYFDLKELANFWLSCNPLFNLGKRLIDRLLPNSKETGELIGDIIKRGKEAGVKKMVIVVSNACGFNFGAPIEGANIQAKAGTKQTIKIEVEYK